METQQGVEIYATKVDLEILRGEMKEGFAEIRGDLRVLTPTNRIILSLLLPLLAGVALLMIKQYVGSP